MNSPPESVKTARMVQTPEAAEDRNAAPASLDDERNRMLRVRAHKRQGRCYELAARGVLNCADTDAVLVHGEVGGARTAASGQRMGHAWIQIDGLVYDPVLDRTFTPEAYREIFDAMPLLLYSRIEAANRILEHGQWGPWHEDGPRPPAARGK